MKISKYYFLKNEDPEKSTNAASQKILPLFHYHCLKVIYHKKIILGIICVNEKGAMGKKIYSSVWP